MNKSSTDNSSGNKFLIPIITVLFLLLSVAWMAGAFNEKVAPGLISKMTDESFNSSEYFVVESTEEVIFEPVAASVTAKFATIISSRILARIEKITVRAGDLVNKGDLLIELEKNDLKSKALQATENIKGIKARLDESSKNYIRAQDLFQKKLTSAFNLDKTKALFQSSQSELTAAQQVLKQAKTTLSYATLKSPISGRVVDRFAEPGNTIQPGNKLLTLYNPLSLRVEAQVREQLALTLRQGQIIEVELPSIKAIIEGEIEEIVPAANTGSRSFLIKVSISYNENLLPGMYARVLIASNKQNKLYVPEKMLGHFGQLDFVWVLVDGTVQRRFVRIGKSNNDGLIAIISGISKGDKIVSPTPRIKKIAD